jgi:hypothetical protein
MECSDKCPIYFKHRIAGIFEGDPGENECPFYYFNGCLYPAVHAFQMGRCDEKGDKG